MQIDKWFLTVNTSIKTKCTEYLSKIMIKSIKI